MSRKRCGTLDDPCEHRWVKKESRPKWRVAGEEVLRADPRAQEIGTDARSRARVRGAVPSAVSAPRGRQQRASKCHECRAGGFWDRGDPGFRLAARVHAGSAESEAIVGHADRAREMPAREIEAVVLREQLCERLNPARRGPAKGFPTVARFTRSHDRGPVGGDRGRTASIAATRQLAEHDDPDVVSPQGERGRSSTLTGRGFWGHTSARSVPRVFVQVT